MNIFLCGSLEPVRDGVGDYARWLDGEVMQQGHSSMLVTQCDEHLSKKKDGNQINLSKIPESSAVLDSLKLLSWVGILAETHRSYVESPRKSHQKQCCKG